MPKREEKVEMCVLHNEMFDTENEKQKHEKRYNCLTVLVPKAEAEWMKEVMLTTMGIRIGVH